MSASFFRGPLPPPEALEKYERIMPGMTDRLVCLHEKTIEIADDQSKHRRQMESAVIHGNIKTQSHGQWMAFGIVISCIVAGTFLIWNGRTTEGLSALFGPLACVLGIFVFARSKNDRDLEKKRKELEEAAKRGGGA